MTCGPCFINGGTTPIWLSQLPHHSFHRCLEAAAELGELEVIETVVEEYSDAQSAGGDAAARSPRGGGLGKHASIRAAKYYSARPCSHSRHRNRLGDIWQ